MAAETSAESGKKMRGGGKALLSGLTLALALGGAGFYATWSGMLAPPLPQTGHGGGRAAQGADSGAAYLPLDPILVTVGRGAARRSLQFSAQIEVEPAAQEALAPLAPRAVDVLNTYLRAVAPSDVEDPAAMLRMRAQMLRRVKVVMGEEAVRDLLVSEFILR